MKKLTKIAACIVIAALATGNAGAQAFRKGTLLVSVSEGATWAKYTTSNTNGNNDVLQNQQHINGDRDPLTVEFGLSKHWGIGLNSGGDIFKVDPSKFYNFQTSKSYVTAFMSEFTVDGNYHFFVTKKLDLSACLSLGLSSVTFKGSDGDHSYKYEAGGGIARIAGKAKYYFFHGLGVMGMISAFTTDCSTKDVKGNTVGQGYNTKIKGTALEFGLCYRILR